VSESESLLSSELESFLAGVFCVEVFAGAVFVLASESESLLSSELESFLEDISSFLAGVI